MDFLWTNVERKQSAVDNVTKAHKEKPDRERHRKMEKLDAAMDKIRSKYGERSIGRAEMLLDEKNEE